MDAEVVPVKQPLGKGLVHAGASAPGLELFSWCFILFAIINGIVFLISFPDGLLLVYRND